MNYRKHLGLVMLAVLALGVAMLVAVSHPQAAVQAATTGGPRPPGSDPRPTVAPIHTVLTLQMPDAHQTDRHALVVAHLAKGTGEPISGMMIFFAVDGEDDGQARTDTAGDATWRLRHELDAGTHTISAGLPAVGSLPPAVAAIQVVVVGTSLQLQIVPASDGGGSHAEVVAHLSSADGKSVAGAVIVFSADGTRAGEAVTDNTGTTHWRFNTNLSAGSHTILAVFGGLPTLLPSQATAQLGVGATKLTIQAVPLAGQDAARAPIVAHLVAENGQPLAGVTIQFLLDDKADGQSATDAAGNATWHPQTAPAVGSHTVTAVFGGVQGSLAAHASMGLVVQATRLQVQQGADSGGSGSRMLVVADLSTAAGQPIAQETVQFFVDGARDGEAETDANGQATWRLRADLGAGAHKIEAVFPGVLRLAPARAATQVTTEATKLDLLVKPATAQDGSQAAVTARLTRAGGQPVPKAVIQFLIDGTKAGESITDAAGAITWRPQQQLAPGNHKIGAVFAGLPGLLPAQANAEFDTATTRLDLHMATGGQNGTRIPIIAHLTTAAGQPIAKATIQFLIDGTRDGEAGTDANGNATWRLRTSPTSGSHKVEAVFTGVLGLAGSRAALALGVQGTQLALQNIPGSNGAAAGPIVAHLSDAQGRPVPKAALEFLIDGTASGHALTDAAGNASWTPRGQFAVGTHKLDVVFNGAPGLTPARASAQFGVSSTLLDVQPVAAGAGAGTRALVSAHLAAANGQPIAKAILRFLVDGTLDGEAATDGAGKATWHIRRDLGAGAHQVAVDFAGLPGLMPAQATASLVVGTSALTVQQDTTASAGQTRAAFTAHLVDSEGKPIAQGIVEFLVDGVHDGQAATDAGGNATWHLSKDVGAGTHKVDAVFHGRPGIRPAQATVQFSVATTKLELRAAPAATPGSSRVPTVAHLTDAAGKPIAHAMIEFLVDGVRDGEAATDAQGEATWHLRQALPAGAHKVAVVFHGLPGLLQAQAEAPFTVGPTTLALQAVSTKVSGEGRAPISAHLVDGAGQPVAGAVIQIVVDGAPDGEAATDARGDAAWRIRKDLAVGSHKVEAIFGGLPGLVGSRATLPLTIAATTIRLQQVPSGAQVGDPFVLAAQLADAAGVPIPNVQVEFLINGKRDGEAPTNAQGQATWRLRQVLDAGTYTVTVAFSGLPGRQGAQATAQATVSPKEIELQTVPALAGVRVALGDQTVTSDKSGVARLRVASAGTYHVKVLPFEDTQAGIRAEFARWSDEIPSAERDIVVPARDRYQVGFNVTYRVALGFADLAGQPVAATRVSALTLQSSGGKDRLTGKDTTRWLLGSTVARVGSGLQERRITYSVESVIIDGANLVNQSQQQFTPSTQQQQVITLLFFGVHFLARDALFGTPIGKDVRLVYPDGHAETLPLGANGELRVNSLPRGQYEATVKGAGGLAPSTPIALSQDQDARLLVVSILDIAVVVSVLSLIALGLLLVGRLQVLARVRRYIAKRRVRPAAPLLLAPPTGLGGVSNGGAHRAAAQELVTSLSREAADHPYTEVTSRYTVPALTVREVVNGSRNVERLIVGDQVWARRHDGRWTAAVTPAAMQVLPEPVTEDDTAEHLTPQIEDAGEVTVLRWYDAQQDADVTLHVDAATGLPRSLRQAARETGAVVTVSYDY